jgi:hypothetical protein
VTEAASRQLQLIAADPEAELQWETAMQIYNLPAACPDMAAYKPLYAAAAKRVFADLGDLEVVCQSTDDLWPKLLQLPHPTLLQLLANYLTRVAREDTVAYVIQQWAQAQPQQPTLQQMQQLCDGLVLRLLECSPLYLTTVIGASPMLAQCYTPLQLSRATLLSSGIDVMNSLRRHPDSHNASRSVQRGLLELRLAVLLGSADRAEIVFGRRPNASQLTWEQVDRWHAFSLRELEAVVQSALRHAADGATQAHGALAARASLPLRAGPTQFTCALSSAAASQQRQGSRPS